MKTTAVTVVAAERRRQVEVEGFDPDHDANHGEGVLLAAALAYGGAVYGCDRIAGSLLEDQPVPIVWPWAAEWWKPNGGSLRVLVKAAALLLAEIDLRLPDDGMPDMPAGVEPGCVIPRSLLYALVDQFENGTGGLLSDRSHDVLTAAQRLLDLGPQEVDEYGTVWAGDPGAADATVVGQVVDEDMRPGPVTVDVPWRWMRRDDQPTLS